jgi:hypothetical protein
LEPVRNSKKVSLEKFSVFIFNEELTLPFKTCDSAMIDEIQESEIGWS